MNGQPEEYPAVGSLKNPLDREHVKEQGVGGVHNLSDDEVDSSNTKNYPDD